MTGRVLKQGEQFEITAEIYSESLDRNGNSFFDLDEAAQSRRWGKILWSEGDRPADFAITEEAILYRQGLAARAYAQDISDPAERAAALKAVSEKYGKALTPRAQ